jgi:hypothetical protein
MINEFWRYLVKSIGIALPLAATLIAAAAGASEPVHGNVTSYWAGTTQARCGAMVSDSTRCNAFQNITLTLADSSFFKRNWVTVRRQNI